VGLRESEDYIKTKKLITLL